MRGVIGEDVTVIAVERHPSGSATITYRPDGGGVDERVLTPSELSMIETASGPRWRFDGDPVVFTSAMEAERIRKAGQFDPMMALSTSSVRPLPHQIRAVYEELLPVPRYVSSWRMIRARARRSWPACTPRS
ncbi:hypothetical protein MTP03_27360 [Tsukamurella sp. PLM1]|nr:hypothetical protein MTP03_27360 [Tsukamurella sp. PLM1]